MCSIAICLNLTDVFAQSSYTCEFSINPTFGYSCQRFSGISVESSITISGAHVDGMTNSDVVHLSSRLGTIMNTLHSEITQTFPNLRTLNLPNVLMNTIDENSLEICGQLTSMDLRENSFHRLSSRIFKNCVNLEILDLTGNTIHTLENEAFDGLQNLKVLSLERNHFTAFAASTFEKLISLEVLTLTDNNIKRLNTNIDLPSSLEKLFIENCRIDEIERNFFGKLSKLHVLWARFNDCVSVRFEEGNIDLQRFNSCFNFWDTPRTTLNPTVPTTTSIQPETTTGAAAVISSIFLVSGFAVIVLKI